MARRFVESHRRDPFVNYMYQIAFGGIAVAACRKVSGLEAKITPVKFRAGNSASTVDECIPGRVEYTPVTFESGMTNDPTFEDWANALVHNEWSNYSRAVEPDFRRDIEISVMGLDGNVVRKYLVHHCFPTSFSAMSELAGDGNDILFQSLEVCHEGFELVQPGA